MHLETRMLRQPCLDLPGLVGPVVIANYVHIEIGPGSSGAEVKRLCPAIALRVSNRPNPAASRSPPYTSLHGHSIELWRGDVLVADTIAIAPQVSISASEAIGPAALRAVETAGS